MALRAIICVIGTVIAIETFKGFGAGKLNSLSHVFTTSTNCCVHREKSRNTAGRLLPLSNRPAGLCAHRKPQVIFHLSTCGILHALAVAAAPFTVCAGSTNDDSLVNLDHDVTDPAPAKQRIAEGASSSRCRPPKMDFPAAL